MTKFIILFTIVGIACSCAEGEEKTTDKNNQEKKEEQQNEQLLTEDGEELFPLVNEAGTDSIDADGNIVYGTADQFDYGFNDEVVPQLDSASGREYTLGPRPVTPLPNIYGEDSIGSDGDYAYPPRDTNWIEQKN